MLKAKSSVTKCISGKKSMLLSKKEKAVSANLCNSTRAFRFLAIMTASFFGRNAVSKLSSANLYLDYPCTV